MLKKSNFILKFNVTILHKNLIDTVLKSQYVFFHFDVFESLHIVLCYHDVKLNYCTFLPFLLLYVRRIFIFDRFDILIYITFISLLRIADKNRKLIPSTNLSVAQEKNVYCYFLKNLYL